MKIIGAGLSGLLAGCLIPGSTIYERQSCLPNNHGAILRFRSNKISKALNIPFREVQVHKAVWSEGHCWIKPDVRMINMYSNKVTGQYNARSIGNCDTVTRYIAPDNFIKQLAKRCEIIYYDVDFPSDTIAPGDGNIISTIPMPVMISDVLGGIGKTVAFMKSQIWSVVYEFDDVNLYQTIYFPDPDTNVYRASFTGNRLIVETTVNPRKVGISLDMVLCAFGINHDPYSVEQTTQEYGKIVDIDPHTRRAIMSKLTHEHNIYSLGRYATWRNILLDDVFEDIYKIMDLIKLDSYSRRLKIAEEK